MRSKEFGVNVRMNSSASLIRTYINVFLVKLKKLHRNSVETAQKVYKRRNRYFKKEEIVFKLRNSYSFAFKRMWEKCSYE